jgi:hypothetical protein
MAILLLNVGSQDLLGPDRDARDPRKGASSSGRIPAQSHLHRLDRGEQLDNVEWPLVSKYLAFVRSQGIHLDRLILFGTDQPETVAEQFRKGDTIVAAEVLRRFVLSHGSDVVRSATVVAVTVDGADRHDRCLEYFRRELPKWRGDDDRVLVAVTGGTPGVNLGLLMAAQATWGDRVEAIGANPSDPAFALDVARQLRVAFQRQPVADLLARGQFATAAEIVWSWRDDRFAPVALAAEALRLWLDQAHDDALARVNQATTHASHHGATVVDDILPGLMADLRALQGEAPVSRETEVRRLTDVYWNADVCFRQERHVDFVARMALVLERAIRCFLEEVIGHKVPEGQNATKRQEFEKALTDHGLSRIEGRGLDVVAFARIAKEIEAKEGRWDPGVADRARRIWQHTEAIYGLRELRNESVVGHRLEAVTPTRVAKYVDAGLKKVFPKDGDPRGVDGVQAAIRAILGDVGHEPTGSNPFLKYGERLARALLGVPL